MRRFSSCILGIFLAVAVGPIAFAQVQTETKTLQSMIIVFYEEGCPDCIRVEGLIDQLGAEHPDLTVARYEINAPGAVDLLQDLSSAYGIQTTKVPIVFVGKEAIVGAGRAEEMRLRTEIDHCLSRGCSSPLVHAPKPSIPWSDLGALAAFLSLFFLLYFWQQG